MRWATVFVTAFWLSVPTSVGLLGQEKEPTPSQVEFFEKNVRPLLARHCLECHGAKKQESGLRLDSRTAVLRGSDEGPIVVVGKPRQSRLIDAIGYEGDIQMPPDGKLPAEKIALLVRWVEMGLPWPKESAQMAAKRNLEEEKKHWAFQPVRKPSAPMVANTTWPQTAIDRFILARLEANKLNPSPAAKRRTLIRRATFDLLGLPPTPAEVEAFVADKSPDAYERVIDRLLASPRYGERWGRHWLDVARYADNKGYVFFEEKKYPWAYTYRDYVIHSLNADLPYDRFVLEQLAADRLELGDDKRALRAMGFLTLGGRFMNNAHDIIDDRIDVITRGLLGLTVTCARCHEHKYDPIPQEDYYSLYGILRSCDEPMVPPQFQPPPENDVYKKFASEMVKRQKKLDEFVNRKYDELTTGARKRVVEYMLAAHAQRNQPRTEEFMLLADKGDLNPKLILRWRLHLDKTRKTRDPVWTTWHALADLPPEQFARQAAEKLDQLANHNDTISNVLVLEKLRVSPLQSIEQTAGRYAELLADVDARWQSLVKQNPAAAKLSDPQWEQLRQTFYGVAAPLNIPKTFGWGFLDLLPDRPSQGEFKKLRKEVETWSMTGAGAPARAMVLLDNAELYQPRVFLRGNPNRLGEAVPRQFLDALSKNRQPFANGSGRLELARAIADASNPLTARVIVNRVWLHHFGRPLVATPSDFGIRSDPPTHPALLDYLAATLVEDGWSLKSLHRRIMLSAVYRQASDDRAEGKRIDPENLLLWKMNRRRLEFEAMRDALLTVSNSLDTIIGGPPVNVLAGFQPRRSVYGFIDRMDVPGLLTTFDFPNPAASSPKREATTVPPQALFLMNNPFAVEAAKRLTVRSDVLAGKDIMQRTEKIYSILFSRPPSEEEMQLATRYLTDKPTPQRWIDYVQALLLTNEFVFID